MALTITEQLSIINGIESPISNTLSELVGQIALNEAQNINDNAKVFDGALEPLADTYLRKMLALADKTISNNLGIDGVVRLLVAIYADTGTIAEVQAATDDQWIAFLESNITKTFELIAGVRSSEKSKYDALP